MSKEYCLLEERWIPVRMANGRTEELGLLDIFARSADIASLAETAPPNLVAQYRLLLAITHRALVLAVGTWKGKDRARWYREGLPVAEIHAYLEHWRERFWLFHPRFPFMQVADLATADETRDKRKPWTQIALASANGNTPVVFDHAYDSAPTAIRPSEAIVTLLGFLQFTPGGLVKVLRDADKAGALVNTAAILPVGTTLAQTLCLCLHPPPSGHGDEDLPAWERDPPTLAELRGDPLLATGPNDRYTRQSRAVLLLRENTGQIRQLHFAAGLALGEDPNAPDPMACFRAGSNGLVRLSFAEGRALWRDLPALVPSPSGESQPAAVLNHAIALHQLSSFDAVHQPLLVAGLASDQAKLLRWRAEQVTLPAAVLTDPGKALYLRELLEKTEALFRDIRRLAVSMVVETMPSPSNKDTRNRAAELFDNGPCTPSFFARAERALPDLLSLIGEGQTDTARAHWNATLRHAAHQAWQQVVEGLGGSARALRADARYWPRFHHLLDRQVPDLTAVEEA